MQNLVIKNDQGIAIDFFSRNNVSGRECIKQKIDKIRLVDQNLLPTGDIGFGV